MNPRFLNVPGYAEAYKRQDELRDAAFLELPTLICGKPCLPMSSKHLCVLTHCDNAFVSNSRPIPEHVAQFLWCLSPGFSYTDWKARDKFVIGCAGLNFDKSVKEIEDYVEEVFLDSPEGSGERSESIASWIASLVDVLAAEYGWKQKEVVEMPLACVFQYIRVIRNRTGEKQISFNRLTDSVKTKFLEKLNK